MEADITTQAVGLATSADFSLINLFIRADIIVKSVIIILIACSVYSWAIIIEKYRLFKKINLTSEDFEEKFSKKSFPDDIPVLKIESESKTFIELIEEFTERSFSRSEIKRLIKDNAIQINNVKELTLQFVPEKNIEYKIKIGKRNFYKVEFV